MLESGDLQARSSGQDPEAASWLRYGAIGITCLAGVGLGYELITNADQIIEHINSFLIDHIGRREE